MFITRGNFPYGVRYQYTSKTNKEPTFASSVLKKPWNSPGNRVSGTLAARALDPVQVRTPYRPTEPGTYVVTPRVVEIRDGPFVEEVNEVSMNNYSTNLRKMENCLFSIKDYMKRQTGKIADSGRKLEKQNDDIYKLSHQFMSLKGEIDNLQSRLTSDKPAPKVSKGPFAESVTLPDWERRRSRNQERRNYENQGKGYKLNSNERKCISGLVVKQILKNEKKVRKREKELGPISEAADMVRERERSRPLNEVEYFFKDLHGMIRFNRKLVEKAIQGEQGLRRMHEDHAEQDDDLNNKIMDVLNYAQTKFATCLQNSSPEVTRYGKSSFNQPPKSSKGETTAGMAVQFDLPSTKSGNERLDEVVKYCDELRKRTDDLKSENTFFKSMMREINMGEDVAQLIRSVESDPKLVSDKRNSLSGLLRTILRYNQEFLQRCSSGESFPPSVRPTSNSSGNFMNGRHSVNAISEIRGSNLKSRSADSIRDGQFEDDDDDNLFSCGRNNMSRSLSLMAEQIRNIQGWNNSAPSESELSLESLMTDVPSTAGTAYHQEKITSKYIRNLTRQ